MLNDFVSDVLSRIRNACMAKHKSVLVPASRLVCNILDVLKENGYIWDYSREKVGKHDYLSIRIKYYNGSSVISCIKRISKPGCRVFSGYQFSDLNDPGTFVLSTSKGVISSSDAYKQKVGGEVLCYIR
jgi:small subunit ribosomal protein S8